MPEPRGTRKITFGEPLLAAVEAHCRNNDINVSAFVRKVVARALGRQNPEVRVGRPRASKD